MNANVQPLRRHPELRYAQVAGRFVDIAANRVRRDGVEVRLTPKAMGVLRELIARPEQVVKRDDLLGIVWRDGFPTDDVLTHAITELRRALEEDPRAPRLIETIPRVGYRLLAPVELLDAPPVARAPETATVDAAPAAAAATVANAPPAVPVARYAVYAAAVLFVIAGALAVIEWRSRAFATPARNVTSAAPATAAAEPLASNLRAVTADPAREQFPSLSPDGSSVAYVGLVLGDREGTARIVLRSLDAGAAPRALSEPPPGARDDYPVWSPDGTQIAFLRWSDDACQIHVMPALGGRSRQVSDCRMRILDYMEWTPDGEGLLLCRVTEGPGGVMQAKGSIHRLDLKTGSLTRLPYTLSTTDADIQARVSPDGRTLAFRRGGAPYSDIYVVPYAGGDPRRLTNLRARMRGYAWYPDGRALLVSSDHEGRQALYRIDVATGTIVAIGIEDAEFPDVARHAPVAVFQKENQLNQLAEIALDDPQAKPKLLAPATRSDSMPEHAPDGRRVAFVSERSGDMQVWIYDAATDTAHPVTSHRDVEIESLQWSPDGRRVLHVLRGSGRSRLVSVEVESRRATTLSRTDENVRFGSYSRDGQWVYFSSDRGGAWQIWRMPAAGGEPERLSEAEGIDPQDPLGDGYLYTSQENARGLFRLDLATRELVRVAPQVGYWNRYSWAVRRDGVYALDSGESEIGGTLYRMPVQVEKSGPEPWRDYKVERVADIPLMLGNFDLSLAPDGKSAVVAVTSRDETDLMAADLALR